MTADEDAERQVRDWVRQTVAFCISLRAWEHGQLLDVQQGQQEVDRVVSGLWAAAESQGAASSGELGNRIVAAVFGWCSEHRFGG